MKRCIVVAVMAVMVLVGVIPSSAAAANTMRVTPGIGLNIRSAPGFGDNVITAMPYGTVVETGDQSGAWIQVYYDGRWGWSYTSLLENTSATKTVSQTVSNNSTTASGPSCFWAHGGTVCAPGWIANTIYAAGARYGVNGAWLMRTAACESGFNPGAVGAAGEIGIFQFKWGTFYGNGGTGDIWSVYNQADRAAYMFHIGQSGQWTCA